MANDLQNVNLDKLAQESLPAFVETFAPLNAFTTDFSTDIASSGQSIGTRYVDELVGNGDVSTGYAAIAEDVTYNPVTIQLDKWKGFTIGFTDLERSKAEFSLKDDFIIPGLEVVGKLFFDDLWALVTAANFTQSTTITAANWDRDDLADLNATLNKAKIIKSGRSVVQNPDYYASMLKTLNSAEMPGLINEKVEAIAPRIAKFDQWESTLADDNVENLAAFACQKSALVIAARQIISDEMQTAAGVQNSTVVVPGLGLPIRLREWYDSNAGKQYLNMNVLYGMSVGKPTAGVRVTSA
jgi:hypothetical protein